MSHIFPVVIYSSAWENRISSTEKGKHLARLRTHLHTFRQTYTFKEKTKTLMTLVITKMLDRIYQSNAILFALE